MKALDELKALNKRRDALMAELDRSLAIRDIWPEAFTHGACSSSWVGRPTGRDIHGIRYDLRLAIIDGAGHEREFPQSDVPAVLWPAPETGRYPK
jgi:hypothetical protein